MIFSTINFLFVSQETITVFYYGTLHENISHFFSIYLQKICHLKRGGFPRVFSTHFPGENLILPLVRTVMCIFSWQSWNRIDTEKCMNARKSTKTTNQPTKGIPKSSIEVKSQGIYHRELLRSAT